MTNAHLEGHKAGNKLRLLAELNLETLLQNYFLKPKLQHVKIG